MRKLLGYVWLAAMGDTQFNSFQTGFLRKTDASHGIFVLERASELAKEWKTPLFMAQLDLKKAFDHVQHSFATAALQHKGVSDQLISILNKWWTQSSVEVGLAGIKSDRRIAFQRGLPQGAPESPAIFVAISDHVLGKLDDGWRNRNIGWKMDNIHLTSIAYADDICLLASSKKDLELMVKECIEGFLEAGLETGLDKTFWTSSTHSPNANLKIGEHTIPWTEKITFVGAKIHLCGNSESAMMNRIQKATGVFEKWSSILCDKSLDLTKRIACFKASVLSSLTWQSGSWNMTKKQVSHLASWSARIHARMLGLRRGPDEDIGSFWMRIHRMGHQCMKKHNTSPVNAFHVQKHRMAGHFARLEETHTVAKVLHCRDLSWWRQKQQELKVNGNKWRGVHPARFACWRWEQDFEDTYGIHTREESVHAINVGWKAIAQERTEWKKLENSFLTSS